MRRAIVLAIAVAALAVLGCSDDEPGSEPIATGTAPAGTETATVPSPTETAVTTTATPPATPPATLAPGDSAAVAAAAALATWLGPVGDAASIVVRSVEPVTWPDGCLGLGRAGRACTEAEVPGFRVELDLGDATYEVRTDAGGDVALWAPRTQILARFAEAGPNVLEFTSDDGLAIVTQAVPGSDFGVDPLALAPGTPVGLGLADAPQSGGLLLVWLDPVAD